MIVDTIFLKLTDIVDPEWFGEIFDIIFGSPAVYIDEVCRRISQREKEVIFFPSWVCNMWIREKKWIKGLEVCYNPRKSKTESKIKKIALFALFLSGNEWTGCLAITSPTRFCKEKKERTVKN